MRTSQARGATSFRLTVAGPASSSAPVL